MASPDPDQTSHEHRLSSQADIVGPLHAEDVSVSRRQIETAVVRVATETSYRDQLVDEPLTHERVEVEHVAIGKYVDEIPPVRQDGDLTVMPVVEEVLVLERRLMLREEVHIRRVRHTERHVEHVRLREQKAVVTRDPAREADPQSPIPDKQT